MTSKSRDSGRDWRDGEKGTYQHGTTLSNLNVPSNVHPVPDNALENPVTVRIPFPVVLQTVNLHNIQVRQKDNDKFVLRGVVNHDTNFARNNSQTLVFTPFDALWPEAEYVVTLLPGVRCWRKGPCVLEEPYHITFKTRRRLTTCICITAAHPPRHHT
ncbi:hypothetical protein CYMTET_50775 [Cymbomonas tetramitiformis]|uniref:Uncharacterized protein n=1 Tax=Cymbomonas tetramitiformis TaxID=36881 RepID=A0AAE0ESG8_9CHLO|nr:hypothetical protein CYMTET_50775 [Cymbomonas tetramitiformis]